MISTKLNKYVSIRFYEELNDFLPPQKKKKRYDIPFNGRQTVKDLIESQGVPHIEIDLILINGHPVDFNHIVHENDDISVYPEFESFNISGLTPLKNRPLRDSKFILDVHLGRLAKYLRAMGFDTLYRNDYDDSEIADISNREKRIILTRDKGLLMRKNVRRGHWVRNTRVKEQVFEITRKFDLSSKITPFKRCMDCNGLIEQVSKESILQLIQPGTRKYYEDFFRCHDCHKIYWKGSHYGRMNLFIMSILNL